MVERTDRRVLSSKRLEHEGDPRVLYASTHEQSMNELIN